MGVVELEREACQLLERPLVVGLLPRPAKPGLDRRPVALGEMVKHVSLLVPGSAAPARLAEHLPHRFPERLRSVDARTAGPARHQAPLDQIGQQRGRDGRVLGRSLPQPERELLALGGDPQRDDASSGPCSSIPSSMITARRRSDSGRFISSPQLLAGSLHERARHRRLRRRPRLSLDPLADRLLRAPVPAGRDAGQHPLQHHPLQRVAVGEMLIGRKRHLGLAVRGPDPRPLTATRRPPSVTSPSSCP